MTFPSLKLEKRLWKSGYEYVCGVDEVGRGCFAGPVVVGAVIFPKNVILPVGIADSKLLSHKKREELAPQIKTIALAWSIAEISVSKINKHGIGKATQMAFRKAVNSMKTKPDFVLIDAFYIKHLNRKKQKAVKDGDTLCSSIAAASIIAKVHRDELMNKLHKKYPQYDFKKNKGYGTKKHRKSIEKFGLALPHRQSFNLTKYSEKSWKTS